VYNVWADGIAVTGRFVNVAGNQVYWAQSIGSNGITVSSDTEGGSAYVNINNNTLRHDHTGVGLDGSGGGGREMTVAANVIVDTCIGVDMNVQAGDYVGGNDDFLDGGYNPETDPNPYPGGENGLHCGVPGAFSSVGVLIQNSESSYVYNNYLDNYVRGVWAVWDGQLSLYFWNPTVAIGTQYNGIGLYYDKETKTNIGSGNTIYFGAYPIDMEDETGGHWDTWNAIQNNKTAYSSAGCYFDHRSEEYISSNEGAGC
jgi:hypothetical protein